MNYTHTLLAALLFALSAAGAEQTIVELWPGQAPDEDGSIGAEHELLSPKQKDHHVEVEAPTRLITNVTKPTNLLLITVMIAPCRLMLLRAQACFKRNARPAVLSPSTRMTIATRGRRSGWRCRHRNWALGMRFTAR